jgi:hypothetical protein
MDGILTIKLWMVYDVVLPTSMRYVVAIDGL